MTTIFNISNITLFFSYNEDTGESPDPVQPKHRVSSLLLMRSQAPQVRSAPAEDRNQGEEDDGLAEDPLPHDLQALQRETKTSNCITSALHPCTEKS